LRFDTNADFSNTPTIIVHFGAVGVGSGIVNNSDFLTRLNSSASGGLMLASHESNEDLNFNTFPLSSAAHMTVAAPETGMTYTGTITPSTTHNTYRLGGGEGTLTLPNNNQLTGANGLYVSNGGEVHITGANNFTGKTEVIAKYIRDSDVYAGTVLAVANLADGGSPSGLGSATSDADNILIRGATLKYTGGTTSTNRLFTIGTGGAILDASGTGAVHFTNAGALGMEVAPDRQGQTDGFSGTRNVVTHMPYTDDLVLGMPVSGLVNPTTGFGNYQIPAGAVINRVLNDNSVRMNASVAIDTFASGGTLVIGDYLRTLTLTGSNAEDNTLGSLVADSPQGPVGITKTGTGKWVLSNSSNAYSGPTTVEEGTLSLTAAFLGDDSEVYLSTGATLELNFAGLDTIGALYIDGVPQPVGTWGGPGSGAANISNLFTGMGRLGVSVLGASMQAVPEPGSLMLAVGSLLAFIARGRRLLV
jgi:fibronectin-binding autotransporter adhesin